MGATGRGLSIAMALGLLACGPSAGPAPSPVSAGGAQANSAAAAAGQRDGRGRTAENTSPSTAAQAPTGPPRKFELPLATISATNTPIWAAVDYGIFTQYGLEVIPEPMAAATASQALSTGNTPAAITGGSSVTAWVGGARNLAFIAGLMNKATFQVLGAPSVTTVEGLRGARSAPPRRARRRRWRSSSRCAAPAWRSTATGASSICARTRRVWPPWPAAPCRASC